MILSLADYQLLAYCDVLYYCFWICTVTCIQFNPVDDKYFISGSLDAKVRIWSIPDRQVVDWNDLHEMVTAACYTPDGQVHWNVVKNAFDIFTNPLWSFYTMIYFLKGALVGSYKGSCRLYNTSGMFLVLSFMCLFVLVV